MLHTLDKLRLIMARALNALYYRTGVKVFRELSNRVVEVPLKNSIALLRN
jgi:hypothetical protein